MVEAGNESGLKKLSILGEIIEIAPANCVHGPHQQTFARCSTCVLTGKLACRFAPATRAETSGTIVINGQALKRCVSGMAGDACEKGFVPVGRQKYCRPCGILEKRLRWTRGWRLSKHRGL